jgi:hypothetical protein
MMDFMRAGGFGMWLVLVLGLATLVNSVVFAVRPGDERMALVRAVSTATLYATLLGITSGIGAVMHKVPHNPEWAHSPDLQLIVMTGLGEALSNAVLGFALLALSWMAASVGMRRKMSS